MLETHAWCSARPKFERETEGANLDGKMAEITRLEDKQGTISVSLFPFSPSVPEYDLHGCIRRPKNQTVLRYAAFFPNTFFFFVRRSSDA